jgi:hypothetical protein
MILTTILIAQLFAPGAAQYPSPAPRPFLDAPVAQCVIAKPCPWGDCVILSPCPASTLVPPQVTPPIAAPPPAATPKEAEAPREPVVIRIEVVPVPPAGAPAVPKAAPKAVPKKKDCPC